MESRRSAGKAIRVSCGNGSDDDAWLGNNTCRACLLVGRGRSTVSNCPFKRKFPNLLIHFRKYKAFRTQSKIWKS